MSSSQAAVLHDQLVADTVKDDVLFINACGLGMEQLILRHLQLYSDPALLVFVINTNTNDEAYFYQELAASCSQLPKFITADVGVSERRDIYLSGGVQFVTSRILIVDLLTDRVPIEHVSGIVVCRAQKLLNSFQESFILRLFRQKKKGGFVKAFTDSSVPIASRGIGQLQTLVSRLYINRVQLLPRFELDVKECLDEHGPEIIEVSLRNNQAVRQVQSGLCDIIRSCLKELKACNPNDSDIEELEWQHEAAVVQSFGLERDLRRNPDRLNEKSNRLLGEIDQLRELLTCTENSDVVSCYQLLMSLKNKNEFETNSGWLFLPEMDQVFVACEKAIGIHPTSTKTKEQPVYQALIDSNVKWRALKEIIQEIREEVERLRIERSQKYVDDHMSVLLLCAGGDSCATTMNDILTCGVENVAHRMYKSLGPQHDRPEPDYNHWWASERLVMHGMPEHLQSLDAIKTLEDARSKQKDWLKQEKRGRKRGGGKTGASGGKQTKLTEFDVQTRSSEDFDVASTSEATTSARDPWLVIKPLNSRHKLITALNRLKPMFVILYNFDLFAIRQVEWYQASHRGHIVRVYWMMTKDSTEEHRYLASLRHEQDAFEKLIREKGTLYTPREYDVSRKAPVSNTLPVTSRKAGGRRKESDVEQNTVETPSIVVDTREFGSELPLRLYDAGLDIQPVTLEVGDFVLTPDVCVERKALADLTQSLIGGRVYEQIIKMCDHYNAPMLLIERAPGDRVSKSHLRGGPFMGEMSKKCRDVRSAFVLLLRTAPKLRILWSMDVASSVNLFEEIKLNKPQPNADHAQTLRSNQLSIESNNNDDENGKRKTTVKLNPMHRKMLISLPGMSEGNIAQLAAPNRTILDLFTDSQYKSQIPSAAMDTFQKIFKSH